MALQIIKIPVLNNKMGSDVDFSFVKFLCLVEGK